LWIEVVQGEDRSWMVLSIIDYIDVRYFEVEGEVASEVRVGDGERLGREGVVEGRLEGWPGREVEVEQVAGREASAAKGWLGEGAGREGAVGEGGRERLRRQGRQAGLPVGGGWKGC